MRFLLRCCLAAACLVLLFFGIGVWHVTLAAFATLLAAPVLVAVVCYWEKPFELVALASLAGIYWLDGSALSYYEAPRSFHTFGVTHYQLKWDKGRLLAFRYTPWLLAGSTRNLKEAPVIEDWRSWPGFHPPERELRFLGVEWARGKYDLQEPSAANREAAASYSMVGIPAWLVVWILTAPPLLRLYF